MIRIALVEDEAEVRAQLQGYVQRHTRQYGTEFAVTEFADGMELLDDAARECYLATGAISGQPANNGQFMSNLTSDCFPCIRSFA